MLIHSNKDSHLFKLKVVGGVASGGFLRMSRCRYQRSAIIAAVVAIAVASKVDPTISAALADPKFKRIAIRVVGINVMLAVLSASKVHMAGEAVSLSGFKSWSCCIALMPVGVAAFPNPSKLALILERIYPMAG
ncbi:hypothetical protein D3C78_1579520 [compost metagenome]